ncbi:hypothetical protein [Roseibium aggregatum]|uniref:Carboxypeptidase regulatory-like domain-containing protein n=1 Tax=Roseibium aggregatum TaxID=187304 RepID=A0A926NVF7_9HYPH|nr:hypothetical protein [Roseibium aggregatum]MBD1545969.1 hypothetical protein [Roseibium aggregatum]
MGKHRALWKLAAVVLVLMGWASIAGAQGAGAQTPERSVPVVPPFVIAQSQPAPKEKPPAQGGPSYPPKYDIDKAMGSKGKSSPTTPETNSVAIVLYMPATGVYKARRVLVFGPGFPSFKVARVRGSAFWESLFYSSFARNQTIRIHLVHNGKSVRRMTATTDGNGYFSFDLKVNAKGSQPVRIFNIEVRRRLTKGLAPPEYYKVPGQTATGGTVPPDVKKQLPTETDWKVSFWNAASKLNAIKKDIEFNKVGEQGTPNLDQWRKNHKAGRDNINALSLLIDLSTSPATATAQAFENANTTWKRLTGKPLPFVQPKAKVVKNALKSGNGFFSYAKRLRESAQGELSK